MADKKEAQIPETFANHCMLGKYEYIDTDKETGIVCPAITGNFIVKRPHATFQVPAWFNVKEDPFPRLEEVEMEEGDALLVTPPKTGTHVMFEIVRMLQAGSAEYKKVGTNERWCDVAPYDGIIASQPKPRVLSTHLPLSSLPPNFRRKDTKVVLSIRNFKDAFVSFYHHMNSMTTVKHTWAEYFNYLMYSKSVIFGNQFDLYADAWDKHRHDPNVLIVQYESICREREETIQRIATHLGVSCTPEVIKQIADANSFQNLKAAKSEEEKQLAEMLQKKFKFNLYGQTIYRKGQIGDWKNLFTVAQNEEFHRKFDEWNKERQIPMIFE